MAAVRGNVAGGTPGAVTSSVVAPEVMSRVAIHVLRNSNLTLIEVSNLVREMSNQVRSVTSDGETEFLIRTIRALEQDFIAEVTPPSPADPTPCTISNDELVCLPI